MATPSVRSLGKAIELLEVLVAAAGARSASSLAADLGLPLSTVHRIMATLERRQLLLRVKRGQYVGGAALLRIAEKVSLKTLLSHVGRPVITSLGRQTGCTAHLGIFEDGMVTYLIKAGSRSARLFTREGTQLEAYCTGIGKVLLSALPEPALRDYLANGPFVALTPRTITEPGALRVAIAAARAQGHACDDAEMDLDLRCLAVPVRDGRGTVVAAISISTRCSQGKSEDLHQHLTPLRQAAIDLARRSGLDS